MSLTAEAIDLLQKSGEPVGSVLRVVGEDKIERNYAVERRDADHVLIRHIPDPKPELVQPLGVWTLAALVGYLKRNVDELDLNKHQLVIASPLAVVLQSRPFSSYKLREQPVGAMGKVPNQHFGEWLGLEETHIWLRTGFEPTRRIGTPSQDDASSFIEDGDRPRLLALLSSINTEAIARTEDDGVSQTVQTKKGLTLLRDAAVPATVTLAPFRSFVGEVEQVPSECIFRVRGGEGRPVQVMLALADGGAWELEARKRVADRLRALLADAELDPALVAG